MVEVFKTNVTKPADADMLISELHNAFPFYKVNFDLDDCDRILRVKSLSTQINPFPIMVLLKEFGFQATPLPDNIQTAGAGVFFMESYGGRSR